MMDSTAAALIAIEDIGRETLNDLTAEYLELGYANECVPYGDTVVVYPVPIEPTLEQVADMVFKLWEDGDIDYIGGRYVYRSTIRV